MVYMALGQKSVNLGPLLTCVCCACLCVIVVAAENTQSLGGAREPSNKLFPAKGSLRGPDVAEDDGSDLMFDSFRGIKEVGGASKDADPGERSDMDRDRRADRSHGSVRGSVGDSGNESSDESGDDLNAEGDLIASSLVNDIFGSLINSDKFMPNRDNSHSAATRRDLRPVVIESPEDDHGEENGMELDPLKIVQDLEEDRSERENEEERAKAYEESKDLDEESEQNLAQDLHAFAATGVSREEAGDSEIHQSSPGRIDDEDHTTHSRMGCRNHLKHHRCTKFATEAGCAGMVSLRSQIDIVHLSSVGVYPHQGAFLVRRLCPHLCHSCTAEVVQMNEKSYESQNLPKLSIENLNHEISNPKDGHESSADRIPKKKAKKEKSFFGIFDTFSGLFSRNDTDPFSTGGSNGTSHYDSSNISSNLRYDGWWSNFEAAVSDADHVVIEHRHLFEAFSLILIILLATTICVSCCCCYTGRQKDKGDYGTSVNESSRRHMAYSSNQEALTYEKYHDEEYLEAEKGIENFSSEIYVETSGKDLKVKKSRRRSKKRGSSEEETGRAIRHKKKRRNQEEKKSRMRNHSQHLQNQGQSASSNSVNEDASTIIGGTQKSRKRDKQKEKERLSNALFGDDNDCEDLTFNGNNLYQGQDDVWS